MDTEGIMTSVYDLAVQLLEKACQDIKDEMAAKGINATGNTSRSFRVERYDGGIRLVMGGESYPTAPLETLEVGRPGGNVPGGFRMTKAGVLDVSNTFKAILVEWAKAKGIDLVVFDRGGYIFHGRVAALAEGAREGGLKF